jgi:hypothetical protein
MTGARFDTLEKFCDELASACPKLSPGFDTESLAQITRHALPARALGSVYERHWAGQPSARKAGGVFYTPEPIVRYVVDNTVGRLIAGKTPGEVAAMRFADIACGGGWFLLEIYDALLRHHAKSGQEHPGEIGRDDCVRRGDGSLRLSASRKREILLNNIFGVDIDPRAVKVAQRSLYLKLLEDETVSSVRDFQKKFHCPLLPSLERNIVCGNSLVGTDIRQSEELTERAARRLKPMDFAAAFPQILGKVKSPAKPGSGSKSSIRRGDFGFGVAPSTGSRVLPPEGGTPNAICRSRSERGFDAVVGNPPYVFGEFINRLEKDYFTARYELARGQYDLYHLFYERALQLTRTGGYHGYIVPDAVLARDETVRLRRLLLEKNTVTAICHVGKAFPDAGVSTAVIVTRAGVSAGENARVALQQIAEPGIVVSEQTVSLSQFLRDPKVTFALETGDEAAGLLEKLRSQRHCLGEWCEFSRGEELGKKHFHRLKKLKPGCVWILVGENVRRYALDQPVLQIRRSAVRKDARWYKAPKLVIVKTGERPNAALETRELLTMQSLYNGRFRNLNGIQPEFLLAVVNSNLLAWYLRKTVTAYKKVFPQFNQNHFAKLPVPKIDFSCLADKLCHDRIAKLVRHMLTARKKQALTRNKDGKLACEKRCANLDRQIDRLVYRLYGLTRAEVRMVESQTVECAPSWLLKPADARSARPGTLKGADAKRDYSRTLPN